MSGADPGIFLSGGWGCLVVAIGEVLLQEPIHPQNLFMYYKTVSIENLGPVQTPTFSLAEPVHDIP